MPDMSPTTRDCGYIKAESLPLSWQRRLNVELPRSTDVWMVDYFEIVGGPTSVFMDPLQLVKEALESNDLSKAGAIQVYPGSWKLERQRPFTLVDLANNLLGENTLYHPKNIAFLSNRRLTSYLGRLGQALGYEVKEAPI